MNKNILLLAAISLGSLGSVFAQEEAVNVTLNYVKDPSKIQPRFIFSYCPPIKEGQTGTTCSSVSEKKVSPGDTVTFQVPGSGATQLSSWILASALGEAGDPGLYVLNKTFTQEEIKSGSIVINFPEDFKQ